MNKNREIESLKENISNRETALVKQAKESTTTALNIKYIQRDIEEIKETNKKDVAEIKETLRTMSDHFVTQTEFKPVKSVLFGLIGTILLAFVGAIISLILKK